MKFKDCHDECEGCDACDPLPKKDWPMGQPPPYPADDEGKLLSLAREDALNVQVRDLRREDLTKGMTFEHLSELYLTLTDGIVRERLARKTAEHKLYAIKKVIDGK